MLNSVGGNQPYFLPVLSKHSPHLPSLLYSKKIKLCRARIKEAWKPGKQPSGEAWGSAQTDATQTERSSVYIS